MTALHQKLEEWIISQSHLLADRRLKLFPETSVFCRLTEGKNRKIWKYVADHVRSYYTADKVRRILRVKECQVGEAENPYPVTDADQILKRIAKCEEKRTFLNESISQLKRETATTEDEVKSIVDKVSILNQKSAILELIFSEYNKKCAFLNSIQSQLNSYVLKNSKPNTEFYLVLNFPLVHYKSNFGVDQITNKVNCLLKQIHSLLMNSNCKIFKSLTLVRHVNQMLDTISLAKLFIYLKEISKASYIELMSNETYSASAQSLTIQKQNLDKYLQGMKLKFIKSCFATKKTVKETHRLLVKNESLFKNIMLKNDDVTFEKKCEILKKMAENVGLFQSIEFLENTLHNEQNEAKLFKEAKSGELEAVVKNFFSNFSTLCVLLKSGSYMHESIIKSLLKLYTYANKQMFSSITRNLKEYPFQMQHNLIFDIHALWSILEKNNTINPLMPSLKSSTSENLMTILDVSKFENECVIGSKVKKIKDKLSSNQDREFKLEDDSFSDVHAQYITLIETLQRMKDKLELCNRNFHDTSEHNYRVHIVLRDWWEQGAQFIPQLEWEDKSLKMWLDILLVLPDF